MEKLIIKDIEELEKLMTDVQKDEAKKMFEKYYKNYCEIDIFYENDFIDNTDYLQEVDLNIFD